MTLKSPKFSGKAAIAFSGGGDSTAMLHAFRDDPRITHAFIVDHALREGSDIEAKIAANFAQQLGYQVQIKRWKHQDVKTGLQAKARHARYQALGQMCRAEGLSHLMTAHSEDDQAETFILRLNRQSGWRGLAGMTDEAYAPIWPNLANVTLLRPWLGVSRQTLRKYNAQHNLPFVDDPSNENSDFARIRARQALSVDLELRDSILREQKKHRYRLNLERDENAEWVSKNAHVSAHGFIETKAVPNLQILQLILRAVSGTGGPIDRLKLCDFTDQMKRPNFKAATLAGAWCTKRDDKFVFARDMVAVKGTRNDALFDPIVIKAGQVYMWDGRFLIEPVQNGICVVPAFGQLEKIRQVAEVKGVLNIPAAVRATMPLFKRDDRWIGFSAFETDFLKVTSFTARRLQAALGYS